MPCISGRFDPVIGPIINVVIAPAGTFAPTVIPTARGVFPGLIDTGASATCISPGIAQSVGLKPMGMRPMTSATESVPVNVYLVDLLMPFGNTAILLQSIQVMEFAPASGSPFQILVGRDIICSGAFAISFDGHFTFSM